MLSTHQIDKTFVKTVLVTLAVLSLKCNAYPYFLKREVTQPMGPFAGASPGFLKALQDLEESQIAYFDESGSNYGYYDSFEPDYPVVVYPSVPRTSVSYEYIPNVDPEDEVVAPDFNAIKYDMDQKIKALKSGEEIEKFSDWIVQPGNEAYFFTFLNVLDSQLVDKLNQNVEEENEMAEILSDIEELAGQLQESNKGQDSDRGAYENVIVRRSGGHGYSQYPGVLAREMYGIYPASKRLALW